MTRIWILGAADPEMAAIEKLLTEAGERVAYASIGVDRVHTGNAYRFASPTRVDPATTVYLVECGPAFSLDTWNWCPDEDEGPDVVRIDHHREGDPGYGRPPEDYFRASSIGQVLRRGCRLGMWSYGPDMEDLRFTASTEVLMVAAADHCLEAAYRGRCPGVDPDALMQWRVEQLAAFQGREESAVLADVEAARHILKFAAWIQPCDGSELIGGADLRSAGFIPELPEAAAREGIPFLATIKDRDGREKVVLQAAGPDLIRRFMAGGVVSGLKDYYGDPARGFAGGYKS